MNREIDWRVLCTVVLGLVVLECFAMSQGINGWLLRIIVMLIAGIGGVAIPITLKGGEKNG